jgi:hypothetical protein
VLFRRCRVACHLTRSSNSRIYQPTAELDAVRVARGYLLRPGEGRIRGVRSIAPSKFPSHTLRKERDLPPAALSLAATRNVSEPSIGLEGLNKTHGGRIPAGVAVYEAANDRFVWQRIDRVAPVETQRSVRNL